MNITCSDIKYVETVERRGFETVRSREKEPLAAVAVAHIVYSASDEVTLVAPYVDNWSIEFIANAVRVSGKDKRVVIVTKRRGLKCNTKPSSIEIEVVDRPLHAKIYVSSESAFITSANLLKTSLLRNIELGVMLTPAPATIKAFVDELIAKSI